MAHMTGLGFMKLSGFNDLMTAWFLVVSFFCFRVVISSHLHSRLFTGIWVRDFPWSFEIFGVRPVSNTFAWDILHFSHHLAVAFTGLFLLLISFLSYIRLCYTFRVWYIDRGFRSSFSCLAC